MSGNVPMLEISRVLTGVGLGVIITTVWTYMGEMFPSERRGRYQSLVFGCSLAGIPIIAFWSRVVVPLGPNGWRYIFVGGAVGLVASIICWFVPSWLPESPRWLEVKGRLAEADAEVSRLEERTEKRIGRQLPEPREVQPVAVAQKAPIGDLFTRNYYLTTIVVVIATMAMTLGFYAFNSWLPVLLLSKGYAITKTLLYSAVIQIGTPFGGWLAYPFTDRLGRRVGVTIGALLVALFAILYGVASSDAAILILGLIGACLFQATIVLLRGYVAEVFPTRIRSTGWGLADGFGRLINIGGSVFVAGLIAGLGYLSVFLFIAVMFVIVALAIGAFGKQTAKRALEEIAE